MQPDEGLLPSLDAQRNLTGAARPQSASKQSAGSFAGSHKKGPIKAFDPMDAPDKDDINDRLD